MSFLTVVESAATDIDNAAIADAKGFITYIDNVTLTELLPDLENALMTALQTFTQTEIANAITALKAAV